MTHPPAAVVIDEAQRNDLLMRAIDAVRKYNAMDTGWRTAEGPDPALLGGYYNMERDNAARQQTLAYWLYVLRMNHGWSTDALADLLGWRKPSESDRPQNSRLTRLLGQGAESAKNNTYSHDLSCAVLDRRLPNDETERTALEIVRGVMALPSPRDKLRKAAKEAAQGRKKARAALDTAVREAYTAGIGVTVLTKALSTPDRKMSRQSVYDSLRRTRTNG